MNLSEFAIKLGEWLRGNGPESDIVISSRIRLARNLGDFPFIKRCTDIDKANIESTVRDRISENDNLNETLYIDVADLEQLDRQLLVERQLISREHAESDGERAEPGAVWREPSYGDSEQHDADRHEQHSRHEHGVEHALGAVPRVLDRPQVLGCVGGFGVELGERLHRVIERFGEREAVTFNLAQAVFGLDEDGGWRHRSEGRLSYPLSTEKHDSSGDRLLAALNAFHQGHTSRPFARNVTAREKGPVGRSFVRLSRRDAALRSRSASDRRPRKP